MRQDMIPRRYTQSSAGRRALSGLGDLIDDYQTVIMTIGDSVNWLNNSRQLVYSTNSSNLVSKWNSLMMTAESLRKRAAAIHYQPSVTGFIENLFGTPSNVPVVGWLDRAISSDMAVYTADAQQFISDVAQLKLSIDQYNRLIASGVSASDASNTIDSAQLGFFDKIKNAVKMPAYALGGIAVVILLILYSPQIKAGFSSLKTRIKK